MSQEIPKKESEEELRNRIKGYWEQLVLIGAKEAKKQGIDEIVLTDNYETQINEVLENPRVIQVYEEGDSCDAAELIEYAKDAAPSLYNEYYKALRKYSEFLKSGN